MRYVELNWLCQQTLLVFGVLFSAASYAATCPTKTELQLQADGYFVTTDGWRSESTYKGMKDPLPVFRQVTLTQQAGDEMKISGCRYDLQGVRTLPLLMLAPDSSTVAPPTGRNWRAVNTSRSVTEYQCTEGRVKQPCEFTYTFVVSTATGGFGGIPFGMK